MIDVNLYWPNPKLEEQRINIFNDGISHVYTSLDGNIQLSQYENDKLTYSWLYRFDKELGVTEFEKNKINKFSSEKFVYVPGKEIFWGGHQELGDSIVVIYQYQGSKNVGYHQVKFEALIPLWESPAGLFKDVLVITYWQDVSVGLIGCAKMWLAPSIGQVQATWKDELSESKIIIQESILKN